MPRLLVLLAVVLWGCPAPVYSTLAREATPDVGRGVLASPPGTGCPAPDSARAARWFRCEPDGFNALLAARAPDRVGVVPIGGGVVWSRTLRVERDTAFLDGRAVPMRDVDHLRIDDDEDDLGRRATAVVAFTGVFGGFAAGLGFGGAATHGDTGAAVDATIVGTSLGLALGLAVASGGESQRVVPVGWAVRPRPNNVLDVGGDGCAGAAPRAVPGLFQSYVHCVGPDEVTAKAAADWVRVVEVRLRDGGVLTGSALALAPRAVQVDGRAVPFAEVESVALRRPHPPLRTARLTVRSALVGAAYGSVLGAGIALATGDPDDFWPAPLAFGAVGGAGGLAVGLLQGRDAVRDVTFLPDPAPEP